MKSYALLAPKNRFTQLILLEMQSLFGTVLLTDDPKKLPDGGLLVYDADCFPTPAGSGRITVGYTKDASLANEQALLLRPFLLDRFREMLKEYAENGGDTLSLRPTPSQTLPPLTKTEETLLSILLSAKGQIVSKRALADALFPEAEDGEGSVTVYIHYLRKKLESDGKRRILSHRNKGYSIPSR